MESGSAPAAKLAPTMMENATAAPGAMCVIDWNRTSRRPMALRANAPRASVADHDASSRLVARRMRIDRCTERARREDPAPAGRYDRTVSYRRGVIRRRVVVSGDVQGVYFRDTCRRVATAEHVRGWVRNLPDGSVEAAFEGSPDAVVRMVEWARHGPRTALVDSVEEFDEEPEHLSGFEIRPSLWRA